MNGKAAACGLLLAIGLALASAAAADEGPFRRWGVGWGDWLGSDYGSRGVSLRYRLTSGWSLTASGIFSQSSSLDHDWGNPYSYDFEGEYQVKPVSRSVGLECARGFALHQRLRIAPVLRFAHSYGRSVRENEELAVDPGNNDWVHVDSRSRSRSETQRFGIGLRPQCILHPRVSVESGIFLDYTRSHYRSEAWGREEWDDGTIEEAESHTTSEASGWSWSVPTPSVSMGLLLFFYF